MQEVNTNLPPNFDKRGDAHVQILMTKQISFSGLMCY